MRSVIVIVLAAFLAGCGVEVLTTTAIQGELQKQQIEAVQRQTAHAGDSTAKIRLEQAVAAYHAETGVYPPSLDALVPAHIPSIPPQSSGRPFGYDPATGRILAGAGPAETLQYTQDDEAKLAAIRAAINEYGHDTGYYPPSLDALEPLYIDPLPVSGAGAPFAYDPPTGQVWAPQHVRTHPPPQPQRSSQAPVGAGPLGETMTGIGMQQELNRMGSSGASSAGSRARQQTGAHMDEHQRRQERALQNLGY